MPDQKPKVASARPLTPCPLCGKIIRIDLLTGTDYVVQPGDDVIHLRAGATIVTPGEKGMRFAWFPVDLTDEDRKDIYENLARKLLPVVEHLRLTVPWLDQVLTKEIIREVEIEHDVPVRFGGSERNFGVDMDVSRTDDHRMDMTKEVPVIWPKARNANKSERTSQIVTDQETETEMEVATTFG